MISSLSEALVTIEMGETEDDILNEVIALCLLYGYCIQWYQSARTEQ